MDMKQLGSMLAVVDTPWFFVGCVIAVGVLVWVGVRAWDKRFDDQVDS